MIGLLFGAVAAAIMVGTGVTFGIAFETVCAWLVYWYGFWAAFIMLAGVVVTIVSIAGVTLDKGGRTVWAFVAGFGPVIAAIFAARSVMMAVAAWIGTNVYADGQWDKERLIAIAVLVVIFILTRGKVSSKSKD